MISPSTETASEPAVAYEPPALTVLGSVEAITLSSRTGSYSDYRGRSRKRDR